MQVKFRDKKIFNSIDGHSAFFFLFVLLAFFAIVLFESESNSNLS